LGGKRENRKNKNAKLAGKDCWPQNTNPPPSFMEPGLLGKIVLIP
jgi:hypothetical protein